MTFEYEFETKGNCDIINITDFILEAIKKSQKTEGLINVFAQGSTCGVTTIEYESGLIKDMKNIIKKLVP
ncbi:MAG: YjbQ family protein, partial [bacterium]|nr:YjbQ family protein [bacterium]